MTREFPPSLVDVLIGLHEACLRTERVTSATSIEEVRTEEIMQLALTKAVEQVGEICNRLVTKFPEFAAAHPDLELKAAVSMRHRLVHGYDAVQFDILWDTAVSSLGDMRLRVEQLLDQVGQGHA